MSAPLIGDAALARRKRAQPQPRNTESETDTESTTAGPSQEPPSETEAATRSTGTMFSGRTQIAKLFQESCSERFMDLQAA